MKNIFILMIVFLCVSCNNDAESKQTAFAFFASINVYLKNSDGANILGTDKYPENSISIKYLIGGKELGYGYNSPGAILDNPQGFYTGILSGSEAGKGMHVFLNNDSSEEYPITYIHWNTTDIDTIKAQYKRTENSVLLEKAWLYKNNEWKEITSPEITIVK